jgi:PST family polysaccharide transporter
VSAFDGQAVLTDAAPLGAGIASADPPSRTAVNAKLPSSRQTTRAALWAILDTTSQTFVSVLAFLIVARILGPREFGVAAISFGIVQIMNLFVETLLQDALVQRENLTAIQVSSAFWWSVSSGAVAMAILFVTAPIFAHVLEAPLITDLLRVMSCGLIFTGAGAVPIALLRRSLSFRKLMTCSIITRVVTGLSSAGLAIGGAGAFALTAQTTVAPILLTSLVLLVSGWRPALRFSRRELRSLLVFGFHVVGAQITWIGGMRLYIVCIGLLFSPTAVGFYNIAQRVVDTARDTISVAVSNLALPIFSRHQNDHAQLRQAVGKGTEFVALLVLPIFAIVGGCATPLVYLLLTDKWLAAVPIIQLFAASAMLHFFRYLQTPAITAAGRPDAALVLSIFSTVLAFAFLFVFGRSNFLLAAAGWAFVRPLIIFPVAAVFLRREIGLHVRTQTLTGIGLVLASIAAYASAYGVQNFILARYGLSSTTACIAIGAALVAAVSVHAAIAVVSSRRVLVDTIAMLRGAVGRSA